LLRATIDYFRAMPQELDRLASVRDFEGIGRIAHGLKSTGGNLMATQLKEIAQKTDASVRVLDPEGLELARQLSVILRTLLAEGESWLDTVNRENKKL